MSRTTSIYLDAIRLTAALTVLFGHLSARRLTDGLLWQLGPIMEDAVTVFFVLSGFVIAYTADRSEQTAASYTIARAARIVSVAFPALLLTFVLDRIGSSLRPDLYGQWWGYEPDGKLWQYLSGVLFLNRIWLSETVIGSNAPYWSLGYEVWYYVIFGVALFAPPRRRALGILATLVFVGPQIAASFPLWLLGVLGYRVCKARVLSTRTGFLLASGSLALLLTYVCWGHAHLVLPDLPVLFPDQPKLPRAYIVGLLFIAHLIGFEAASYVSHTVPDRVARTIRWLAGATFSVYLYHLPIGQFLAVLMPWSPSSTATRVVILGGTLASTFLLAEITERRKPMWRHMIVTVFSRRTKALPVLRP
ncbi:MAG: acyltransferase [Acetobacteraceae bacterium]